LERSVRYRCPIPFGASKEKGVSALKALCAGCAMAKGSGLLSKMGKILMSLRQLAIYKVRVEDDKILIEM